MCWEKETLNPESTMVPININFFLMFGTWKILNICFIYSILNFAIVFLSPTTWWLLSRTRRSTRTKDKGHT
jgi:hypothetical protein